MIRMPQYISRNLNRSAQQLRMLWQIMCRHSRSRLHQYNFRRKKKYVKVLVDGLAVRKRASWDDSAVDHKVQANEVFTIAEGPIKVGGGKHVQA